MRQQRFWAAGGQEELVARTTAAPFFVKAVCEVQQRDASAVWSMRYALSWRSADKASSIACATADAAPCAAERAAVDARHPRDASARLRARERSKT